MNKKRKNEYSRKKPTREEKESFLIFCEGKNTEKIYFDSFKLSTVTIKTIPISDKGGNSMEFVKEAIKEKEKYEKYDNYWVVFDKDDNTNQNFNSAIQLAKKNGFKTAYSNQCFEYWFLCHFEKYDGKIDRKDFEPKLTKYFGIEYGKNKETCEKIFFILYPKTEDAINNAKNIYDKIGNHKNPAEEESSTTVFQLIEQILKNK